MEAVDFPTTDESIEAISPETLERRIDDGEDVTILDTRAASEFEEWHIDGETVEIANVPYFHFLEGLDDDLLAEVPSGDPLVVLCAKGGASEYVSGLLQREGRPVVHLEAGMDGWAGLYEAVEVARYDGPGTVWQYQRPSSGCLGYMVYGETEAAIIDPLRAFTDRYLDDAEALGVEVAYALDTHIHADHIPGVRALADTGVTGVLPEPAVERGVRFADEMLLAADGDRFRVDDITIEAVSTPGHTSGMTSYLVGESLLTTGDGLFVESVARPDLEAGADGAPAAARQLYHSLQDRVLTLPDDVLIGGAHYSDVAAAAPDGTYTATIGELTTEMAALQSPESEFVETVLADMPPRPANYEAIIETNLGQRHLDEEAALELELGPNNCAASRESLAGD